MASADGMLLRPRIARESERLRVRDHDRELFERAPVAYVTFAQDDAIEEANYACAELLGLDVALLVGMRFSRFVAPEHALTFAGHLRVVLRGGGTQVCELELLTESGERRDVRLLSTCDAGGAGWRMVLIDVTATHRVQRAQRQGQTLEALGTLAGGIAHDFNNMLTAILGCAELARRHMPAGTAGREALDDLRRAVDHGRSVTSYLVSIVRGAERAARSDVHEAVSSCAPLLRQQLAPRSTLELALDAPHAIVNGDGGRLEQVVLNLVRNAADAMPQGGRVRVTTRELSAGELPSAVAGILQAARYVLLSVSDEGVGMEPHVARRAFEPFFTTKGSAGTGLGLWMVDVTVRSAGGHLELHTFPGEGTRVCLYLPRVA